MRLPFPTRLLGAATRVEPRVPPGVAPAQIELPVPAGWYAVCRSRELAPGQILTTVVGGETMVVFRSESGTAAALSPHCPHLGAHLGLGRVVNNAIQCPFHGFRFGTDGRCASSPYGGDPPAIHARTWEVDEKNGLLMVGFAPPGAKLDWTVPELDWSDFGPLWFRQWSLASHPQEISENSVDTGHLRHVHGHDDVQVLDAMQVHGPRLAARYAVRRARVPRTVFRTELFGLGFSCQEMDTPDMGIRARSLLLTTPTEPGRVVLRLATSVGRIESRRKLHPLLAGFPVTWLRRLIAIEMARRMSRDLRQDFPMWIFKTYHARPGLAKGDGPIAGYRRWASQFYPGGSDERRH